MQTSVDGLLPEGDRRARLAARFGLRPEDTFGLLGEIGWECAGAVAVLPEGQSPASGRYEPIDDAGVAERLDALPSIDLDPDDAIRMSLGGAQDKLLLARIAQGWALPIDGAPSTHILKPEPDLWPGLAAAEAWALRVASAATRASAAELSTELGARQVIVVTRYDRQHPGDRIVRIHQEDLCQALGLQVGLKYARPGHPDDPSLARLARILVERAVDPPAELIRLLEQVAASVALRNADSHAKNLSILHQGNAARLAPLYDVAPNHRLPAAPDNPRLVDRRKVQAHRDWSRAPRGRGHLVGNPGTRCGRDRRCRRRGHERSGCRSQRPLPERTQSCP